jgi:sulfur relay (sulfurtransferase) DsrC/TusE family protein
LRDNPTVVEVLPPDYNEIKTGYDTLQSKYRNLQSTNESYAKTNESLRRKLAEAKAHENGMSLQELAEEDKAFSQYIKSKHEEAEDAKKFGEALSKLDMLTDNEAEVRELCRCYLAHKATEANRAFVMKSTAQKIRLNIKKLEAALSIFEQGKLSVIK